MGNKIINNISDSIKEMKSLIRTFEYDKAKGIYEQIQNEIKKIDKLDIINELLAHLLEKHTDKKLVSEFEILITNLKNKDKLIYLFELIYENELVESIDINPKINKAINSGEKVVNIEENYEGKDLEKLREIINDKMKKICEVNNYLEFLRFKSILFEKIAEEYNKLGETAYSKYEEKNNQNLTSKDLQEIVDLFSECINNYQKTYNQKSELEKYTNSFERVKAHQNILLGKEHLKEDKFEEALNYFKKVEYKDSQFMKEKHNGMLLCNEKLAELESQNENYDKAIEYYKFLKDDLKIFEMNIRKNKKLIIECIQNKNLNDSFKYFKNIFELINQAKFRENMETKYKMIFLLFIELIIQTAIMSYQNNYLKDFIDTLTDLKLIIENNEIKLKVEELINELNQLNELKNDDGNLYFEYINKEIDSNTSEIKQRFYLSLLIIKYLNKKPQNTLMVLLKKEIKLYYLNSESFNGIKKYFKDCINFDHLFLVSKLIHKIIVGEKLFQKIDNYKLLGEKILYIIDNMKNLQSDIKFNEMIEYLIGAYQEILINNTKIKNYNVPQKVLCTLILLDEKFINITSRGLLFLSKNGKIFEKRIMDIIISNLIKIENETYLMILMSQYELKKEENLYLESIYNILLHYQKIGTKIIDEKIFSFLLSLSEEKISSKLSINKLEEYMDNANIHPLFYELIKKIPINKRTKRLSQNLSKFKESKSLKNYKLNNENIKRRYTILSLINKDDLPELEKNLDDNFYVDKLIYYLKSQKFLFNHLNLEEICKHFSPHIIELLNLIIDKKIKFNEKALLNLLNGFYKDFENNFSETFDIFNKIKKYQGNFPIIIETNLKLEEYLNKKEYKAINNFDIKLKEILNDFSYLNGFGKQHQQFILYLLKINPDNQKDILKKSTSFLIDKYYDIGTEIYEKIIDNISLDEFINIIPIIFSSDKFSLDIKNLTKVKLYFLLIGLEDKTSLIKSLKLFIDFITIPNKIMEYLIGLLNSEADREIKREIIFCLGNYFSTGKKSQKYLNMVIKSVSQYELYQNIKTYINSLKSEREILYLYSCLNYKNLTDILKPEKDNLSIPLDIITNIIGKLNNRFNKNKFNENIEFLNNFYKYDIFCPIRDKFLRELYFNHKNNSINDLKLICH